MDGHPAEVHRLARGPQGAGWALRGAGDFDGDGRVDLLFHHPEESAAVVWFLDGFQLAETLPTRATHFAADGAVLGDYDGDGRCDVAWLVSSQGRFEVWMMDGAERHAVSSVSGVTVTEGRGISARSRGIPVDAVAVGDYDGDGRDDLVLQERESGTLHLRMMDGARSPRSSRIELEDPAWRAFGLP